MSYEVWRTCRQGWQRKRAFRWHWVARLYAWEHTSRGWFRYEVRATRCSKTGQGGSDDG